MYLRSSEQLRELLTKEQSSAVILNDPGGDTLPLAAVLRRLLAGRTHSFTALVGYFGHRVQPDVIARYEGVMQTSGLQKLDGEDPAGLIVHEAIEENVQQDRDFEHTAFRLLAGAMSSNAARDAARAWYWLCRFRHEAPDGVDTTDGLRDAFIRRVSGPDESFIDASAALFEPGAYPESPFNLDADELSVLLDDKTDGGVLERRLHQTLYAEVLDPTSSGSNKEAAILLGFLLQRRADFRLNPQERAGAMFHPKIYVVERGDEDSRTATGTVVGSHNWTAPGLGLTDSPDRSNTNVEVATLHLDDGHRWSTPPSDPERSSLGARVCGTARHLFDSARFTLGSWERSPDNLLPADRLPKATENRAGELELNRDAASRESFRSLLVYLRHLVAGLGHINLDDHHDEFFDRFRLSGRFAPGRNKPDGAPEDYGVLFGGKIPASYQVDGAIRLLSMLEGTGDTDGSRGAFLTDEAGLGKTLSAKMTLAILATTRLAGRRDLDAPLKLSLIVPAALTGSAARDGRAPSGWHLHAREVRRATRALLADVCDGIDTAEAERLTSEDHLQIRVLSQGIFSPSEAQIPDAETREEIAADDVFDERSESRLRDFQFIAESELVAIDESHAFRNQRSRRTRTLRLLLSLPVPGEHDWPLVPPGGAELDDPSAELSDGVRRRVLCLSATPFNNRIEDIITQIGHFAQYQDWQRPYGTIGQLEMHGDEFQRPLDEAIATWRTSGDEVDRTAAFRTIVKYARRHLHRTRALSVPADQLEQKHREGDAEELRSRYDDLGPEYIWGPGSRNYRTAFAKALQWLNDEERNREESVHREDLERRRFEARQELESVLTSLFVQRSRIRALRIIEAAGGASTTGGESNASAMFRKPRRPRQPLALNRHYRASASDERTLEAGILDNLFRLLYPSTEREHPVRNDEDEEETAPQLSLKAYEISALRGQRSAQAARNAIGFQITNLIKRLQSTPYSFFKTLVNGVFRRSLTELALVEHLVDDVETGDVELPDSLDAGELRERLDTIVGQLDTGHFPRLPNVVELIGGHLDPGGYGRPTLAELVGLDEGAAGNMAHPRARDVDEHYAEMLDLLEDERQRLLWDPDAAESLADDDQRQGWVAVLLHQVEKGLDSSLWRDVATVLEVTEELSDRIWGRGNQNVGKPFDDIWADFRTIGSEAASGVADWLADRLDVDERARTLMAWLLVQAAARTRDDTGELATSLRSGGRTLIFTEYKDTQDYLLALFAALHVVFRDPGQNGRHIRGLREQLVDEMRTVADDLHAQSERVAGADTERFHFADPTDFASPVVDGTDGWLRDWLDEAEDDPEAFARAVADLAETFVRVHGDEADRLLDPEDIEPRLASTDAAPRTAIDSQVDAFSPWYQLEPEADLEDAEEALGYVERLREAADFPVYTLLTTDVLAEGVNLQECGVVVHFDLPWNPTKLIQRNGRIDRRLNPAFEHPNRREQLHDRLLETASEAGDFDAAADYAAPEFTPPRQVYHLTVLPIEPQVLRSDADPALARRVRESLQEKLEAIRTLFGLSNWPIVLTWEDTQEVLTGELDFETPGFRRREDLFAAFRQLEDSATEANERFKTVDARLSVHLHAPESARNRLVDLFADAEAEPVADAWSRVRAAGIVSWTKPRPRSYTVRSDNEWVAAEGDGRGALSGILVVEDDDADGGYSFVTWGVARGTSVRDTTGRRILPAYVRPTDVDDMTADAYFLEMSTLQPLDDWQSLDGAAPAAPSELAADLVKTVIDVALDGEDLDPDRERKDEPYPADDVGADVTGELVEFLTESSFLNYVLNQGSFQPVSNSPGFGTDPTRVVLSIDEPDDETTAPEPAFNLWITFDS